MREHTYPFSAIIGQEPMKKALLLNLINPKIGGVLIYGEKGTAKSTAVRALARITDCSVVEVPLGVTEERLIGSVDVEQTMQTGKTVMEPGILKMADGNILYVDEINLLPDYLTDILLEVSGTHCNRIEREGISYSHPCDFVLVGTMNPEEGELRPHFLDRFGLSISIKGEEDAALRVQVLKNRLAYESDPEGFCKEYLPQESELRVILRNAQKKLLAVEITEEQHGKIAEMCIRAGVEGHRGDLVMEQTARTIAALAGREEVTDRDLEEAAFFALPHRQKPGMEPPPPPPPPEEQEEQPPEEPETPPDQNEQEPEQPPENDQDLKNPPPDNDPPPQNQKSQAKPQNFITGEAFRVKDFGYQADRRKHVGHGKRSRVKSGTKSGRYISAAMARTNDDLALDATIRAAAPYQRVREKNGMAITIHKDDIREKVRQRKVANLLVFVLDTSGSMGANRRMTETKGAVLSLLKDAYVKRDKIALVTFGGDRAEVALPPTSSTERGYRLLESMTVGGKTPLNDGITKGMQVIQSELRKSPDIMPLMIIITDGRGNVSIDSSKSPRKELLEIGERVGEKRVIQTMVIDIEKKGFMKMDLARSLAQEMRSTYYQIDDLRAKDLLAVIAKERNEEMI